MAKRNDIIQLKHLREEDKRREYLERLERVEKVKRKNKKSSLPDLGSSLHTSYHTNFNSPTAQSNVKRMEYIGSLGK
jgi:hypothetical protein